MKPSTVPSLILARILYDEAKVLIESNDRHMCSAGLIILQDALEIIFLTLLAEKGIDEEKGLDSKGFDELIGELKKAGVTVPKSGTLKALNKQRVITKHYGQLAEPVTVRSYAEAAELALAGIIPQVLGKTLQDIFLSDLLNPGEAREFLNSAAQYIQSGKPLEALIEIRKAIFVEIEHEYTISDWIDVERDQEIIFDFVFKRGQKAPAWKRNKQWIRENVKDPVDYVQVDPEVLRLDVMEWGVNTSEIENLLRLTPSVYREKEDGVWYCHYASERRSREEMLASAKYCLDRAIAILLKKQQHNQAIRWPRTDDRGWPKPLPKFLNAPVYASARTDSPVIHNVQRECNYFIQSVVTGFDPGEKYYKISGLRQDPKGQPVVVFMDGYLLVQDELNS